MSFSDETLMAYADGELDLATHRAVEAACMRDAALSRRVEQFKLRRNVFAGFTPGDDALGQRVRPLRQATVVSLDAVRARREASQQAARKASRPRHWSWPEWSALAGVLVIGVLAGKFGLDYLQADIPRVEMLGSRDGVLVAQGRLATALEQQVAAPTAGAVGAPAVTGMPAGTVPASATAGGVRIGMSFVSTEGTYCRSFASGSAAMQMDGVACKTGQEWRIPVLVQNPRPAGTTSGGEVPSQVEMTIEQRLSGEALDAKAEQEAMQKGWQR